jgi:hypothetical protein
LANDRYISWLSRRRHRLPSLEKRRNSSPLMVHPRWPAPDSYLRSGGRSRCVRQSQ